MRHEARVLDAHAEPQAAHARGVGVLGDVLHDESRPGVGARVHGAEGVDVVAAPASPRDAPQVETVVDPEVHERGKMLLVDRVPEPKLRRHAIVEPLQDRKAVTALGRRGEAEQLPRTKMVEHPRVRGRGGVVELVDDDDVEVLRRQRHETARVQALNRREDVLVPRGPGPADPLLAERRAPERVTKRRETLVQDLLAVGGRSARGAAPETATGGARWG
jgi:hypothetical protein